MAKLGGLKSLDAICAKLQTGSPHSKHSTPEQNGSQNEALTPRSENSTPTGSRKNKRKARAPRNLMQLQEAEIVFAKDELEEYEINNKDADFDISDDDPGELIIDEREVVSNGFVADCDSSMNGGGSHVEKDENKNEKIVNSNHCYSEDNAGAIDLSMSRTSEEPIKTSAATITPSNSVAMVIDSKSEKVPVSLLSSSSSSKAVLSVNGERESAPPMPVVSTSVSSSTGDAAAIKDYAQSTMNELLSIYGLNDEAESIVKDVPLQNFASGKILGRHVQHPTLGGGKKSSAVRDSSPAKANVLPTAAQGTEGDEAIYVKFIESMTKLSSMPEGTLIGNPPVLLPTTINSNIAIGTTSSPVIGGESSAGAKANSGSPLLSKHFTTSTAYIKACFDEQIKPKTPEGKKPLLPDYAKYVKRYQSWEECQGVHCHELQYKEHFHCLQCSFRVFLKKDEMVRHFKWHKKRDESLQHGFMRYSPTDDCSEHGPCTHNRKQTHYHCLQPNCNKVYISTSDVQMHANYHRKDSQILQEGFQRFRATEDCGKHDCSFHGQRTTHFHCLRTSCNFTFKNKADMEKHKSYHQKDEVLGKDGFKKFMKYENCTFQGCKYSKVTNHIHCIREGCDYVLHSTGQLYSHKRKHERRDFEKAYQRFKQGQKVRGGNSTPVKQQQPSQPAALTQVQIAMPSISPTSSAATPPPTTTITIKKESEFVDLEELGWDPNSNMSLISQSPSISASSTPIHSQPSSPKAAAADTTQVPGTAALMTTPPTTFAQFAVGITSMNLNDSLNLPIPSYSTAKSAAQHLEVTAAGPPLISPKTESLAVAKKPAASAAPGERRERDTSWLTYLTRYTANDPCQPRCEYLYKDHYHCKSRACGMMFRSKEGVREHARHHEQQERVTALSYRECDATTDGAAADCGAGNGHRHYHCLWVDCSTVITEEDKTFARLEHYRCHQQAHNVWTKHIRSSSLGIHGSPDDGSKRKRGRPPKYPRFDIPVVPKVEAVEGAEGPQGEKQAGGVSGSLPVSGIRVLEANECPDNKCVYFMKRHFHCTRPRCHHASDREDVLQLHAKDFHNFINILPGFEFFDRDVNCRRPHCHNNRSNRHFHCVRPKCDYSFVRYSTMSQHNRKHELLEDQAAQAKTTAVILSDNKPIPSNKLPIPRNPKQTVPNALPVQQVSILPNDLLAKTVVKAAGTYFPISSLHQQGGAVMVTLPQGMIQVPGIAHMSSSPSSTVAAVSSTAGFSAAAAVAGEMSAGAVTGGVPLTVLLQQKASVPQMSWSGMQMKMHHSTAQNCGRPFCKLKKREHFHCFECNQAFSEPGRLRNHMAKHGIKIEENGQMVCSAVPVSSNSSDYDTEKESDPVLDDVVEGEEDNDSELNPSSSLTLNPNTFSDIIARGDKAIQDAKNSVATSSAAGGGLQLPPLDDDSLMSEPHDLSSSTSLALMSSSNVSLVESGNESVGGGALDLNSSGSRKSGRKRSVPNNDDFVDSGSIVLKQRRVSSPRGGKDDFVPEGYIRFRFSENCKYPKCAYRENLTHYHCDRVHCGYSFSDRSRMVQHSLRHERYDTIMGDEFRQYKAIVGCDFIGCDLSQVSTHFHCLRCPFVCLDTNKVLAHRKHHVKMANILALGFSKFTVKEDCGVETCNHSKKQSHYHCMEPVCAYVALTPSQMAPHRAKHLVS